MSSVITILEVSRKQDYVFGSKKLRENAARSADISYVTSSVFFGTAAEELYREDENLVYSGGGHTVLQFPDRARAVAFSRKVTEAALRQFSGLELFVTHMDYDDGKTPGENLSTLSEALERKKALRANSFRQTDLGVELLDNESLRPVPVERSEADRAVREPVSPPEGWEFPSEFEKLAEEDNFIAVVHIDGNSMGKRVQNIYEKQSGGTWEECCRSLRRFSEGIQSDFEKAFSQTVDDVIEGLEIAPGPLPIRPVILAGDDVCFVTKGAIGLECARIFLEKLSTMENQEDGKPYAACAGVAMVHVKFPFHQAYDLAEELCSSAKAFGAGLDENGSVSAMDWHIEFGQLKDSLSELRRDYETEDGNRLELHPVAVLTPKECKDPGARDYRFFRGMCGAIQGERGKTARRKLKEFRTAMKQGEVESRFYLHDREIFELMDHAFLAEHQEADERMAQYRKWLRGKPEIDREAFRQFEGEAFKRCLYFDAIEMADHWKALTKKEVER